MASNPTGSVSMNGSRSDSLTMKDETCGHTDLFVGGFNGSQKIKPCLWCRIHSLEEREESLRAILERYMFAYPAFRMKPIGEPGSPARIESERLMQLEEQAQRVLAGGKP